MVQVRRTEEFMTWLCALRDPQARARIEVRIGRVEEGNFGDCGPVGDGVSELRFFFGPGYRVYYARPVEASAILLCGGDKDTQERDIARAKSLAKELE